MRLKLKLVDETGTEHWTAGGNVPPIVFSAHPEVVPPPNYELNSINPRHCKLGFIFYGNIPKANQLRYWADKIPWEAISRLKLRRAFTRSPNQPNINKPRVQVYSSPLPILPV